MAGNLLSYVPGAGLLRQAWDATKLAGVILDKRKQKALVLASERHTQVTPYRGKNATKRVREVFESGDAGEIARLFVPDRVVTAVQDAGAVYWKVWDLYWILAALRVGLVLLPENGYLHPDEFFQTAEVAAGDALKLQVERTWEFNVTSPLRSMVIPTALFGGPLRVFAALNALLFNLTGLSAITAYTVLVVPRLAMVALSFVVDYSVYQVCLLYQHSFNRCLVTLASSYVMLVYATRTLTNSIEMALGSLLFYMVAACMKRSSETVLLQSLVKEEYEKAESIREKVKLKRRAKQIPPHDFHHVLPISIICAVGFFNRPTFVAFAMVPMFFWLQRGLNVKSYFEPFILLNFRGAALIPGFLFTSLLFILLDSLYYGELTLTKLWELSMNYSDWKVAPLQFLLYNVVPGNLDKHGTHPVYLHALVNIPLLYGPLGLCTYYVILRFVGETVLNRWGEKPSIRNVSAFAIFSFISGLGLLSMFPHQEPRFLIPLTVPVVLLSSHILRYRLWGFRPLLGLWYTFNIAMVLFYGFIHQGGVTCVAGSLSGHLQNGPTEVTVVFARTYMPPRYPLLQPAGEALPHLHWNPRARIHLEDFAGKPMSEVKDRLVALASRSTYLSKVKRTQTLVVLPRHLVRELAAESKESLDFSAVTYCFPHLSTEHPPHFDLDLLAEAILRPRWDSVSLLYDFLSALGDFTLGVYDVKLGNVPSVEMQTERASSV